MPRLAEIGRGLLTSFAEDCKYRGQLPGMSRIVNIMYADSCRVMIKKDNMYAESCRVMPKKVNMYAVSCRVMLKMVNIYADSGCVILKMVNI